LCAARIIGPITAGLAINGSEHYTKYFGGIAVVGGVLGVCFPFVWAKLDTWDAIGESIRQQQKLEQQQQKREGGAQHLTLRDIGAQRGGSGSGSSGKPKISNSSINRIRNDSTSERTPLLFANPKATTSINDSDSAA
jgi:hypothetical protein